MTSRIAGVGWLLAAVALLVAYRMGAEWGSDYAVGYGSFAVTRGEAVLRLNLLLLVLPAGLALAWGVARLAGPRLVERWEGLRQAGRGWDAALALWLVLATWAARTWLLHGAEVTDDENAYHFQARLLESGRLFVASLPQPFRPFLDNQFIVNDGHRYAGYFVGHPAWLAAFSRLGLADLAGPVATALTGLLATATARRIFGARVAVVTAGLLATSPFLLLLGATHLSQPTSGLFVAGFLYALVRIQDEPGRSAWWAAGAASISAAMLARPQAAVGFLAVGVGAVAWAVWRGTWSPGRRPVLVGLGVGAAGIALLLLANLAQTGHPLRTPYAAYLAQGIPWIFPVGPGYSLRQAAESVGHLQFWLFGWPVSLLFLPFFVRTRLALVAAGMVAAAAALFAAVAVPTVAPVGPVYFGESIGVLAMLSASGIERAVAWTGARLERPTLAAALAVAAPCLTVLGLVTFLPPQLAGLQASARLVRAPYDLVEERALTRAVVFVEKLPGTAFAPGTWAYYHRSPDPDLADPVIFVKDLGPAGDAAFVAWLGDRRGYRLGVRDGKFGLELLRAP